MRKFFLFLLLSSSIFAENLKIAVVAPLSGEFADFGNQIWQGAIQAAYDLNIQGGVDEKYIELVKFDDMCSAQEATKIAESLVKREDISAVIGHYCTSSLIAAIPFYKQKPYLVLTPSVTKNQLSDENSKIFRLTGTNQEQAKVASLFIATKIQKKNIALFYDDSLYAKELKDNLKSQLETYQITPKIEQLLNKENINHSLKESLAGVDLIYYAGYHNQVGVLSKFLHENKIRIPLVTGDTVNSNSYLKVTETEKNAAVTFSTFTKDLSDNPKNKPLIEHLKDKSIDYKGYTLYAYSAVEAVASAIKNNNENLSSWLYENEVDTTVGKLAWDKFGNLKNINYNVYIWDAQGNYLPVLTTD